MQRWWVFAWALWAVAGPASASPLWSSDQIRARRATGEVEAVVFDLRQEPGLQPTVKLAGSRLPGFRSGWFWLRDGRKAYVLSTTGSRVLYLPRKDGNALLLGMERPDALLQSVRDGTGRRS